MAYDPQRDSDAQAVASAIVGRRVNATGNVRVNCPLCPIYFGSPDHSQSLSVHTAKGTWKCWRCMRVGPLPDSIARAPVVAAPVRKMFSAPSGFVHVNDARGSIAYADTVDYLIRRIGLDLAVELGFGVCVTGPLAHRVIMPLRDRLDGRWWGWVARTIANAKPKYRYPPGMERRLFNPLCLQLDTREPALIVEGVFDAIPYWPQAVACLGKPTDEHVEMLAKSKRPLALCLDGDAWREADMLRMRLELAGAEQPMGVVKFPPREDPGSIPARAVIDAARKAARTASLVEVS